MGLNIDCKSHEAPKTESLFHFYIKQNNRILWHSHDNCDTVITALPIMLLKQKLKSSKRVPRKES